MSRRSEGPWYRKGRGWYATIGKRQVRLAGADATRDEAVREWHRIMAAPPEAPAKARGVLTVRSLLLLHLDHVRDEQEPLTWEWHRRHSKSFIAAQGELPAADLRPHHVEAWAGSHGWAASTRRGAISAIKRAFSWARRAGHIDEDTVRDARKPRGSRRAAIMSAEQAGQISDAYADERWRDFFAAILETGCRPGEAAKVEAKDFDPLAGTWTVRGKTTNATGKMRVVYLNAAMIEMSKKLTALHPTGPLFRNARGRAWTRHAYSDRIRRARKALGMGKEVVAYSLRHLWITDALERGIPIATVAEVVGHSDTNMISEVYSMLHQRTDHLREAVNLVRPLRSRDRTSAEAAEPSEPAPPSPSAPPGRSPGTRRGRRGGT